MVYGMRINLHLSDLLWVNEGELSVGDTIMLALVGGDIRDNVAAGLTDFVKDVKTGCVTEKEIY